MQQQLTQKETKHLGYTLDTNEVNVRKTKVMGIYAKKCKIGEILKTRIEYVDVYMYLERLSGKKRISI